MPCSPRRASGSWPARRRRLERNLGLHTAPLRVDARCCVVVLVETVAEGSDIRGGSRVVCGGGVAGGASFAELASLCPGWRGGGGGRGEGLAPVVFGGARDEPRVGPGLVGS